MTLAFKDIEVVPPEAELDELRELVAAMERRHGCVSAQALREVQAGTRRETSDVGRWLRAYRTILRIEADPAHAALTSTRATSGLTPVS